MKAAGAETVFDRELADLPSELRWREWMHRIEAVLFASATPVARDDLARVVGQGASLDLLIEDLAVDLEGRPCEVAQVGPGWMLRTRAAYAPAIRAAADVGGQALNLSEFDLAVLAAIAFHQPISREGLKDIFGREIGRDLIGRLAERGLIATARANPAGVRPTASSPPRPSSLPSGWSPCATCPIRNNSPMPGSRRRERLSARRARLAVRMSGPARRLLVAKAAEAGKIGMDDLPAFATA